MIYGAASDGSLGASRLLLEGLLRENGRTTGINRGQFRGCPRQEPSWTSVDDGIKGDTIEYDKTDDLG